VEDPLVPEREILSSRVFEMRIEMSEEVNGGIGPVVLGYLSNIPADYLYHPQHLLRHPVGTYNVSLAELTTRFRATIDEYLKVTTRLELSLHPDEIEIDELLANQSNLLYALAEHIDAMFLILKALVDPATSKSTATFADRYVRESKLPGFRAFEETLEPYRRGYLGPIVNRLKHQQCYLRGISMYGDGIVRIGYYLEEPDARGALGPSRAVHKDGNSAFSFARDLLFNLFNVYYCSERLAIAICAALEGLHGIKLPLQKQELNSAWQEMIQAASEIGARVFPDEIHKGFPLLRLVGQPSEILELDFPGRLHLRIPSQMKIAVRALGDGSTTSFKMPYFGLNN
jgi:hypothetical protein